MRSGIVGTALATLILLASAHADAIFQFTGAGSLNPVTHTSGTGMTITGRTSTGLMVDFSSTNTTLMGHSSQPIVTTSSTGGITNLTISVPGFSFLSIGIRPVALIHHPGTIEVSAKMSDGRTVTCGSPECPFGTTGPDSPLLRISGTNGERILSITITATNGSFANMRQVYFGNAHNEFAPVPTPEPSALEGLLVGFGMLGFAGMTSRKLKLGT